MREQLTTVLDVLGLVAIAVGVGAGSARWLGWFGVAVGGLVVAVGSGLWAWRAR